MASDNKGGNDSDKKPPKEYREEGATKHSQYADSSGFKYPINSEQHVRAAISYFSKPKNAGVYSTSKQRQIWGRIKRAAKKYGIETSPKSGPPSVEKAESGTDGLAELISHPDNIYETQPSDIEPDVLPREWRTWRGFDIALEAKGGEIRPNGMVIPAKWVGYGYFVGIEDENGEFLDVCLGPKFGVENIDDYCLPRAYQIQNGDVEWKVMLGFEHAEKALIEFYPSAKILVRASLQHSYEQAPMEACGAIFDRDFEPEDYANYPQEKDRIVLKLTLPNGNDEFFEGDVLLQEMEEGKYKQEAYSPPNLVEQNDQLLAAQSSPELRLSPAINYDLDPDDGAVLSVQAQVDQSQARNPNDTIAKIFPNPNGHDRLQKAMSEVIPNIRPETPGSPDQSELVEAYFDGLLVITPERVTEGDSKGPIPEWHPEEPGKLVREPAAGGPKPMADSPTQDPEILNPGAPPDIDPSIRYGALWLTGSDRNFDSMMKSGGYAGLMEQAEAATSAFGSGMTKSMLCKACGTEGPAYMSKCMSCGVDGHQMEKSLGNGDTTQHIRVGIFDFDPEVADFLGIKKR